MWERARRRGQEVDARVGLRAARRRPGRPHPNTHTRQSAARPFNVSCPRLQPCKPLSPSNGRLTTRHLPNRAAFWSTPRNFRRLSACPPSLLPSPPPSSSSVNKESDRCRSRRKTSSYLHKLTIKLKKYSTPYLTIECHLKGRRGIKSKSLGRSPNQNKKRLVEGLLKNGNV